MRNVLLTPSGQLVLLDWGCSNVNVIPYADVAVVVSENDPTAPAMQAFFEGYGSTWSELKAPLAPLAVLSAVDVCRWAIDRCPEALPKSLRKARWALDFHWRGSPWYRRPIS